MTDQMELPDSWKTSSGMLDDVDVSIVDARFAFDASYNNGQSLCLFLDMQPDEGEMVSQRFSVGEGWEPAKNGAEMVRADGKNRHTNANSSYGKWFVRAAELASSALVGRGDTFQAKVWIGTRWHVETISTTTTFRNETEPRTFVQLVPSKFLGIVDVESGSTGAGAGSAAPAAEANGNGAVPTELRLTLIKMAKQYGTHDEFMMAALADEVGALGNTAAEAIVMDPAWWASTKG